MLRRLLLISALTLPALASADSIRSWTDQDGVVHFSNVRPAGKKARYIQTDDGVRVELSGSSEAERKVTGFQPRDVSHFDEHLREACDRYKIPYALARAIMAAESNFNPGAISHAGAQGLMQLMPATAVSMYVDDAFDPRENVHGGVRYLRVLTNEFQGDLVKVIAAYNAGPEAVKRAGGVPNIEETKTYVERVLKLYRQYKQER